MTQGRLETYGRPNGWLRLLSRLPIALYRARLGFLLDHRFLMTDSYSWISHTTSESAAQGVNGAWLARLGFLTFGLAVCRVFVDGGGWRRRSEAVGVRDRWSHRLTPPELPVIGVEGVHVPVLAGGHNRLSGDCRSGPYVTVGAKCQISSPVSASMA